MSDPSLRAVRKLLTEFLDAGAAIPLGKQPEDIGATWRILKSNRLCNIVADDRTSGVQLADREVIWSVNAPVLATIYQIAPCFEAKGIAHLFIKGPLLLRAVHGDYFFRPATDVDVLVAPDDFDAAATLLQQASFELEPDCNNVYWRHFLGEQHFQPRDKTLSTVDLHKRIRHPSGPATPTVCYLLKGSSRFLLGDIPIRTPSSLNLVLLTVSYLVKGLIKNEPSGYFLLDLATLLRGLSDQKACLLLSQAAEQNMHRALALCLLVTREVLRLPTPLDAAAREFAAHFYMSGMDLFAQVMRPSRWSARPRLRIVCKTADGGLALTKAISWEVGRKIAQKAWQYRLL